MLPTCALIIRPMPSSAMPMATVTMTAMVIVRLRLRPIHTSEKMKFARMLWESPVALARSVRLAVNAARLIPDDLAVLQLDHPFTHGVDNGGVMGGHDDGGAGPVDPVEHLHDPDAGRGVDVSGGLIREQDH